MVIVVIVSPSDDQAWDVGVVFRPRLVGLPIHPKMIAKGVHRLTPLSTTHQKKDIGTPESNGSADVPIEIAVKPWRIECKLRLAINLMITIIIII